MRIRQTVARVVSAIRGFQPPRSIRPTREGWWFLLVTVGVGLAATNTGNNLLFLLLAMLLSFIIISGLLSEQSLRSLAVSRVLPKRVHAGHAAAGRILVSNASRRLPAFSLHIQGAANRSQYLVKLAPQETVDLREELLFGQRGLHILPSLKVSTRYPFSLFHKTARPGLTTEVLVYPRLVPLPPVFGRRLSTRGASARYQKGRGSGLYDLRPYRDGDDLRLVHWKTTAKVGEFMLKELEQEEDEKIALLVEDPLEVSAPGVAANMERDIEIVASLAADLLKRGAEVALLTSNGTVPYGRGMPHLERIFEHLALYHPRPGGNPEAQRPRYYASISLRLGDGRRP